MYGKRGGGGGGLPVYRSPVQFQKGYGFGNFLAKFLKRGLMPFLTSRRGLIKEGAKALTRAAAKAGLEAGMKSFETKTPFKENLKIAAKKQAGELIHNVTKRVLQGQGRRRRPIKSRKRKLSSSVGHRKRQRSGASASRRAIDIFDFA